MRRSFAFRLALAFAGVGIAAAALTAILVNLAFGSRFTDYLEEQRHARQHRVVAALADSYVRMGGWNPADLEALAPMALMDGGALRLEDAQGRTVWEPSADAVGAQMVEMHREMMGSGPLGPEHSHPVTVDDAVVGTAVMRLPEPGLLPQDTAFRASVNRLLLLGGIVAGLAALLLGILLARKATAPARELTRAAGALARGDRSRRAEFEGDDDFAEMARSFNLMAEAIEREDALRRSFAADVAHELRTPLSILRTQIEAIQDGLEEASPSTLASLHEETLRLSHLVADLETLASADGAGFSLRRVRVPLGPLLDEAVREFAGLLEAQEVSLEADLGDVVVEADPARLRQVVANLLSNALKFTPPGGAVRVELGREGSSAVIRISDTGPGIPPDELPRIFDRFFRGRESRTGGSGVGLTVVRELVEAHGGSIEVETAVGRGTTFIVRLPGASSRHRPSFTAPSNRAATVRLRGGDA